MIGSTADRGTNSLTSTAEGPGMPAALNDINGRSAKLEVRLKRPGKALLSPFTTLMTTRNSGVASMMNRNSGVSSMVAEDLGVAFIKTGGSGVANQTGEAATLADELAGKEAALADGGSGLLGADLDMAAILDADTGWSMMAILEVDSGCGMAAILGIGFGCDMEVVTNTGNQYTNTIKY